MQRRNDAWKTWPTPASGASLLKLGVQTADLAHAPPRGWPSGSRSGSCPDRTMSRWTRQAFLVAPPGIGTMPTLSARRAAATPQWPPLSTFRHMV